MEKGNILDPTGFVNMLINRLKNRNNTVMRAAFLKADNPDRIGYCLEYLYRYCDITNLRHLKIFGLIGAAMAREKTLKTGGFGIGAAIRRCYREKRQHNDSEDDIRSPESLRLRRLLSCNTSFEACNLLRPLLRFIQSKGIYLDYVHLINELVYFNRRTKLDWAKDFYSAYEKEEE
jgi:CRISPR system Cascade subunit CasB